MPLSELAAEYERYVASGEINSTVDDQAAADRRGETAFAGDGVTLDHLDGLTLGFRTVAGSTCARPTPSRCCG